MAARLVEPRCFLSLGRHAILAPTQHGKGGKRRAKSQQPIALALRGRGRCCESNGGRLQKERPIGSECAHFQDVKLIAIELLDLSRN